ncbi:MAG: FHA domain-containing protein [Synechococcaceae cyanobacterium RL_1_2]|nr:FHA domain-containing protein [Synechococcaceae cyanobacterium RL_1_2]
MVDCPNCHHSNPDGAEQCEACFTPLAATEHVASIVPPTQTPNHNLAKGQSSSGVSCPNCGSSIQPEATFCGECGERFAVQTPNLSKSQPSTIPPTIAISEKNVTPSAAEELEMTPIPDLAPLPDPEPIVNLEEEFLGVQPDPKQTSPGELEQAISEVSSSAPSTPAPNQGQATQLQLQSAKLLHVQTNNTIDLPQTLNLIHIGKPNDVIPPDIDVSGFPNSDIVSRCHANIRVEGDNYFLEDVGSSNGTYVNHVPLPTGNRHKLRAGDRFSLGKGDKVTFIFQMN